MASASGIPCGSSLNGGLFQQGSRRDKSRTLLILPVSVRMGYNDYVGIVRDVSASGMFLYSNFRPPIGAEVELNVTLPAPAYPQRVIYRGIVVRLTTGVTGAAVGIGLSLIGTRPASALESLGAALLMRETAMTRSYRRCRQRK
jgi:hypothetical protein